MRQSQDNTFCYFFICCMLLTRPIPILRLRLVDECNLIANTLTDHARHPHLAALSLRAEIDRFSSLRKVEEFKELHTRDI